MAQSKDSIIWIISGPSGSGKTSLVRALLRDRLFARQFVKSVSYTTRPKRPREKEDKDYIHIVKDEFLRLKNRGEFLETQELFGFSYGTPKTAIGEAQKSGKDILLCIDVQGGQAIKKIFPGRAFSIFITTADLGSLSRRLLSRRTESKAEVAARLTRAKKELSYMKDYDYIVVNDDFKQALKNIKSILTAKQCEGRHVLRSVGKTY